VKRRSKTSLLIGLLSSLVLARDAHADDRASACADAAERGQDLRDARQLVEARALFVTCAQRECPTAVRDSCTEWLSDVDRRLPSIVVAVKDTHDRDVNAFVATLDGARLPADVAAKAVTVNPGTHTLRVEAGDHEPASKEVVLREGQAVLVVEMKLKKTHDDVESAPKARRIPILPIVLGGTAVVALGLFGYFGLRGAADYRHLERTCSPNCTSEEIDNVRTTFFAADLTLVIGIASGVAAGALLLIDRPATSPKASSERRANR
jgi:hypothetical protein